MSLSSFALYWVFQANAQIKVLDTTLALRFEALEKSIATAHEDSDDITKLEKQMTKQWKLQNWNRDQINTLRNTHDLDLISWPDLD